MTYFFMDLILVAVTFVSVFRGFWALRRRALPTRTMRLATSPEPGCRPGLRLVASSEEGLDRRAVTIACVGTTEELECLLRTLDRRATLELVHDNENQLDETAQPRA
jgi:hypothetical protein